MAVIISFVRFGLQKNQIMTYQYVSANITKEGNQYRVRFQKNGKRTSRFFTSKKQALAYRKEVMTSMA